MSRFQCHSFIFDTLDGTISAWNPGSAAGGNATAPAVTVAGARFTGLTLGTLNGSNFLYAADTRQNVIDVFDGKFANVTGTTFAGKFVDPNPVAGFTVYNVQVLNGALYATYAARGPNGPLPGGFVDKFDLAGNFLGRIATNGVLNSAWGLAIAPAGFGALGGDLLVGNLGDSKINAFNPTAHNLDGTIQVQTGFASPVGLWAIAFGNGESGNPNALYFTSGVNDEKDGLFGAIVNVPEPPAGVLAAVGGLALAAGRSLSPRRRTSARAG